MGKYGYTLVNIIHPSVIMISDKTIILIRWRNLVPIIKYLNWTLTTK